MPPTRFESMDLENLVYLAELNGACGERTFSKRSEKESKVLLIFSVRVAAVSICYYFTFRVKVWEGILHVNGCGEDPEEKRISNCDM